MNPISESISEAIDRTLSFTRHVVERSCSGNNLSPFHALFDVLFTHTTYNSFRNLDEKILRSIHKYLVKVVNTSPSMALRSAAALELAALFAAANERDIKFE